MVKPLAKKSRAAAILQRPGAVEKEIAEVLGLDTEQILERARITDLRNNRSLSSECLVHLIRHALHTGDKQFLSDISKMLFERCTGNLWKKVTGFLPHRRQEVIDAILERLIETLLRNDSSADFFEVKFNKAFMRLRIDVIRRCRHDAAFHSTPTEDDLEGVSDGLSLCVDAVHPLPFPPEDALLLRKALQALSEEEYEILSLRYCSQIPVNPSNSASQSIVKLMRLSERTIRNRLEGAKEKLRAMM